VNTLAVPVLTTLILCFCRDAGLAAGPVDFTPANPPEMKPLADHDSPAYRAAKQFRHGVNLGNYLETPPGQNWGVTVSADELGCYTGADPASRARFYAAFRRALDGQKLGWAIWDWSAGFRYWDKQNRRPVPGMPEALFGK
jgi:hypothetical protein